MVILIIIILIVITFRNINVTLGKRDIKADITAAQEVFLPPPVSKVIFSLLSFFHHFPISGFLIIIFKGGLLFFWHHVAGFCSTFIAGNKASNIRGKGIPVQRKAWTSAESVTQGNIKDVCIYLAPIETYSCQVGRTLLTSVSGHPVHLLRGRAYLQLCWRTKFRKSINIAKQIFRFICKHSCWPKVFLWGRN